MLFGLLGAFNAGAQVIGETSVPPEDNDIEADAGTILAQRWTTPTLIRDLNSDEHLSLVTLRGNTGLVRRWSVGAGDVMHVEQELSIDAFNFATSPVPRFGATPGLAMASVSGTIWLVANVDGDLSPWAQYVAPFLVGGVDMYEVTGGWRCLVYSQDFAMSMVVDDAFGNPTTFVSPTALLDFESLTYCESKYPTSGNGDCSRTPADPGIQACMDAAGCRHADCLYAACELHQAGDYGFVRWLAARESCNTLFVVECGGCLPKYVLP